MPKTSPKKPEATKLPNGPKGSKALANPDVRNINLTTRELQYVLQSLAARPFGEVQGLIIKITGQVQAQQ